MSAKRVSYGYDNSTIVSSIYSYTEQKSYIIMVYFGGVWGKKGLLQNSELSVTSVT